MSLKCNVPTEKNQTAKYTKSLEIVNPYCAGLDIHKEKIWVCTSPFRDGVAPEVSTFATDTASIEKLAAYIQKRKITTVAMESTVVYWLSASLPIRFWIYATYTMLMKNSLSNPPASFNE
jgi:hypothetical protein